MRGAWGECSFTGGPKDTPSKALEMGVCFHTVPSFAEHGGTRFPRAFERREKFIYLFREIFMRNLRGV